MKNFYNSYLKRAQYFRFPRKNKISYITYKYRTSLNIKRILTAFYSPLTLSKLLFNPHKINGANNFNLNKKNYKFIASNLEFKLKLLESRTDVILYRSQWAKSIQQARYILRRYLPNLPHTLAPGDSIRLPQNKIKRAQILNLIYKNKMAHLKKGQKIPDYLLVNTSRILFFFQ